LGRGPSRKTISKNIRSEVKARYDAIKKWYEKNPQVWLGERFASIIANTNLMDIAKLGAVLGMTLIVKKVFDTTQDLNLKMQELVKATPVWVTPFLPLWAGMPFLAGKIGVEVAGEPKPLEFGGEMMEWLISFCFAWLIINNFGQIMETVGDVTIGVKGILTGLLL